jgi:peroxiredoxin family protein
MFIRQQEELNPVLSGYFSKLVSLLISRKQKFLIPYIFAPESDIIEHLVRHVGQKSISEILNKLLTQIDQDFMQEKIQQKQQSVVEKLIDHLGADKDEENNLNACAILQDMFEIKEFFNILVRKDNFERIRNLATAGMTESTKSSKTCSLSVLN